MRLLRDFHGAAVIQFDLGGAGDEQVHIDLDGALRIDVAGHGGDEAGDVAEGQQAMPNQGLRACWPVGFERVGIEEVLPSSETPEISPL